MRDMIEKLEELNKEQVNEDLGDMAREAEKDHEVQMARSELYKAAKYAVGIHKMLKDVSEMEGIDGWVAAKITKAADYLGSVKHYMEGVMMQDVELAVVPVAGDMTDAMTAPVEDDQAEVEEETVTLESVEVEEEQEAIEEEDVIGNLIGKLGLDKAGKRTGKDEIGDIIAKLPKKQMPKGPAPRPANPVTQQKQANAAAKMPSAPPARPERPRSMGNDTTAPLSQMKNWSK